MYFYIHVPHRLFVFDINRQQHNMTATANKVVRASKVATAVTETKSEQKTDLHVCTKTVNFEHTCNFVVTCIMGSQ